MSKQKRAKPWPGVANRHRLEAIMSSAEIEKILQQAKTALRKRSLDLCLALIAQAETKAQLIKLTLESAPSSNSEGESDE